MPYWTYEHFDLDSMTDDECKREFRFLAGDTYTLVELFNFPDEIICNNGVVCDITEAICMLLKRFAYPCRYQDLIPRFGRPVPQLCMITNKVLNFLYLNWSHLLTSFQQNWLSQQNLDNFANIVHNHGAPLDNCWGFIDGTVRPIYSPTHNRELFTMAIK